MHLPRHLTVRVNDSSEGLPEGSSGGRFAPGKEVPRRRKEQKERSRGGFKACFSIFCSKVVFWPFSASPYKTPPFDIPEPRNPVIREERRSCRGYITGF